MRKGNLTFSHSFFTGWLEMNKKIGFQHLARQKMVLIGIIGVLMVIMTFLSPKFLHVNNFINIFLQLSPLIIIASAANLLMITGNFDLSVGSVFAFCAIMHAYMTKHEVPIGLSVILCCIIAVVWGASNGFMVGILNVNPVIATMGTMYAARGFAYLIARWDGGANISAGLPPDFSAFGRTNIFGIFPIIILFSIISTLIFLFIEKKTVLGRFSFAIGGNRSASVLSGIDVPGVIIILYSVVGLLAGLCGVIQVSRVGSAFPNIGEGMEFDVVVAIVLGGTSMLGGEGSTIGMILGAFIVGLAANGLNLLNVPYFYQTVTKGILLIIAVFADQIFKHRG
jgi:ribose/xylose/arabinose/galactoside ABC-type transport system permease subunit